MRGEKLVSDVALDNFEQSDVFEGELFERFDCRFAACLQLLDAARNNIDKNVGIGNNFLCLFDIIFSQGSPPCF